MQAREFVGAERLTPFLIFITHGRYVLPALQEVRLSCATQKLRILHPTYSDARWIKWMVAWLILMEATSSALASFVAYDYA